MRRLGSAALVATIALVLWALPSGAATPAAGAGTAMFGPVTTTFSSPESFPTVETIAVQKTHLTGVLVLGDQVFEGQMQLDTISGQGYLCSGSIACADPFMGSVATIGSSPVDLTGNGGGQHVIGTCSGGWIELGPAGETLLTTCTAAISGGPSDTFTLAVAGVQAPSQPMFQGVFCVPGLSVGTGMGQQLGCDTSSGIDPIFSP